MKILMMKISLIILMMIPFLKNPMSMGTILLIQTMLMSFIMNKMILSSWFVMITFLMMIGGLLILFTYMSSIASNEKFKLKLSLMLTTIILILIYDEMMNENQIEETQKLLYNFNNENLSMIKLYNKKSMFMTTFMVLYLLLTMISISFIVKHNQGPLRNKT
uniref:NADH dehydrogenase subunit 6 n=1 Tax=Chudania hellerina TaxID=2840403 RepID=A0A8E8GS22_9HEMI|nr:NADH dehydrogenase subunit 6 [Chudania hellerina]